MSRDVRAWQQALQAQRPADWALAMQKILLDTQNSYGGLIRSKH
jgi:hypothetical protein